MKEAKKKKNPKERECIYIQFDGEKSSTEKYFIRQGSLGSKKNPKGRN